MNLDAPLPMEEERDGPLAVGSGPAMWSDEDEAATWEKAEKGMSA